MKSFPVARVGAAVASAAAQYPEPWGWNPDVSSDRRKIAFQRNPDGDDDLYARNVVHAVLLGG